MQSVKVPLKHAEMVKRFMIDNALFDTGFRAKKDKDSIYFPINDKEKLRKKFKGIEFVDIDLEKAESVQNAREKLASKLSKEEFEKLKTAYDVLGDIAILEIPGELKEKEKLIAEAIMASNKTIKTVVKKSGIHSGEFRTQEVEHVAGEKKTEALYKENNVRLKLDVGKVYFSPRLSTERKRIVDLVKEGEEILVMFSGCAPYPIVLSKNTKAKYIVGIELNPVGHKYGLENIKLNKLKNVKLYCGDVKEVVPKLKMKFDRILMPLPKSAEDFLDSALAVSKKNTMIHFYDFLHEYSFNDAVKCIEEACKRNGMRCKILSINKCGQHAPYIFRICVDFEII